MRFRFSLAGLMGGVAVAALLCAVIVVRPEKQRDDQCRANLQQIAIAMQQYNADWCSFPPAAVRDPEGKPLLSWRALLVPYVEGCTGYWEGFHLDEPWDSPHNLKAAQPYSEAFRCPNDRLLGPNHTSYMLVTGPGTAFAPDRCLRLDEIAGGQSTVMIVEVGSSGVFWTKPEDLVFGRSFPLPNLLASPHRNGRRVGYFDGRVGFVLDSIKPEAWRALMTIQGNEEVDPP